MHTRVEYLKCLEEMVMHTLFDVLVFVVPIPEIVSPGSFNFLNIRSLMKLS